MTIWGNILHLLGFIKINWILQMFKEIMIVW